MAGVGLANKDIICRSSNVVAQTLGDLLGISTGAAAAAAAASPSTLASVRPILVVPIFQRRYVWGAKEWGRMLEDACKLNRRGRHRLGRIIVVESEGKKRRRTIVVDGQQRLTTSLLFLAAVRNCIKSFALAVNGDEEQQALVKKSQILCQMVDQIYSLASEDRHDSCPAFVPTYFDRVPFFEAVGFPFVTGSSGSENAVHSKHSAITKCLAFFTAQLHVHFRRMNVTGKGRQVSLLSDKMLTEARRFISVILNGFDFLVFSAAHNGDLMVMYERLALREASIIDSFNVGHENGVAMCSVDLIRNLLLSYFQIGSSADAVIASTSKRMKVENEWDDDAYAVYQYEQHWVPIEAAIQKKADEIEMDKWTLFEQFFVDFILRGEDRVLEKVDTSKARSHLQQHVRSRSELLYSHTMMREYVNAVLARHSPNAESPLTWPDPRCAEIVEKLLVSCKQFACGGGKEGEAIWLPVFEQRQETDNSNSCTSIGGIGGTASKQGSVPLNSYPDDQNEQGKEQGRGRGIAAPKRPKIMVSNDTPKYQSTQLPWLRK